MSRRAQLAMVHIARKDLGLDEDTYRDVLERVTGKRSAAETTDFELTSLIADFKKRGWVPKPKVSAPAGTPKRSAVPQVRKVWAIWSEMCRDKVVREPTKAALRAFVKRMTGVADPEWLSSQECGVVIEALKAWRKRETGT